MVGISVGITVDVAIGGMLVSVGLGSIVGVSVVKGGCVKVGVTPSVGIGLGSSVLVGVGSGGVLVTVAVGVSIGIAVAVLIGVSVGARVGDGVRVGILVGVSVGGHSTLDNGLAAMRAKNINNELIIPVMILYLDILSFCQMTIRMLIPSPPGTLPERREAHKGG
jgi:hypothetical protein